MESGYTTITSFNQERYPSSINYNYLYTPLQKALRKYGDDPQSAYEHNATYNLNTNYLQNSKVAKASRQLSSSQAQNIRANIIFPQNKILVPTKNFEKISGKSFVAVDVQERVKQPISYHEFMRVKTDGIQQIVYQIQEEDETNKVFTYTARNINLNFGKQQPQRVQNNNKVGSNLNSKYQYNARYASNQAQNQDKSQKFANIKPNLVHLSSYNNPSFRPTSKVGTSPLQMPSFINQLPRKYSYSINEVQNEIIIESNPTKSYKFKKQKMNIYEQRPAKAIQNKLNLFNMFDQCGNNGCSNKVWKANQICASRVAKDNWK